MNYQRIYDEIIADSRLSSPIGYKHKNRVGNYKEHHHIKPRCLFENSKDPLKNAPENLIYLTARRHFIVHKILTKIYPNDKKIFYAFGAMFLKTNIRCRETDLGWCKSVSKNYTFFKEQKSFIMKGNKIRAGMKHTDETKLKMSNSAKGHTRNLGSKRSEEVKQKLSVAAKGHTRNLGIIFTEEHKKNIGTASRGRIPTEETRKKISIANKGRSKGCEKRLICIIDHLKKLETDSSIS